MALIQWLAQQLVMPVASAALLLIVWSASTLQPAIHQPQGYYQATDPQAYQRAVQVAMANQQQAEAR